jgi:hypothetical protein
MAMVQVSVGLGSLDSGRHTAMSSENQRDYDAFGDLWGKTNDQ